MTVTINGNKITATKDEFEELIMWLPYSDLRKEIKQHKTKTELYLDVKKYLNNEYEGPKEV